MSEKEEPMENLYSTIKSKFEEDGVLQEVRCLLQSKMVTMMKGKTDKNTPLIPRGSTSGAGDGQTDSRMQMLHQLILEYFHWHGFHYSAEMFAMESATENTKPVRECLEGVLGNFEHKNLPILLELIATMMDNKVYNTQ
ncbi:uncharacterized protein LOC119679176 [Teleopsis dalmanni]|uniref:uncharacterized protein LOC119679176 n=1 Tax=Teleopsis dalmanni TaxID=139649 RepID=UPI000D32A530|nr:uncharacterized protein LOC119679176 [Teleopsis dalmanni]